MEIKIPPLATEIIEKLNNCGYDAYVVGGFVRDALLGKMSDDCDITTSAEPSEVKQILSPITVIETGIKHGTVTAVREKEACRFTQSAYQHQQNQVKPARDGKRKEQCSEKEACRFTQSAYQHQQNQAKPARDGKRKEQCSEKEACRFTQSAYQHQQNQAKPALSEKVEITTFRTDGEYLDRRHPASVSFSKNIDDDLTRRDFTINAIAYHPEKGIYDPLSGCADIDRKIIRCVGESEKRFGEDALRILRALRFSAVLGFSIDPRTADAIKNQKNLLQSISAERILSELQKLICGDFADNVIKEFSGVINAALHTDGMQFDCPLSGLPLNREIRFAALLMEKGDKAREILNSLHADNALKNSVSWLLKDITTCIENRHELKHFVSKRGYEHTFSLAKLQRNETLFSETEKLKSENPCLFIKDLAVDGNDVIKAGITDGAEIGNTLKSLLQLVIDAKASNDKESLLKVLCDRKHPL